MILAGDYIPKGCRVDWRLPSGTVLCNLEAPVLGDAPERFRPSRKQVPAFTTLPWVMNGGSSHSIWPIII